jgi:hypothetical protein
MFHIRKTENKIRNNEGEEKMKTEEGNKGKRERGR